MQINEIASGFLAQKEKELLPMPGNLITFEIGLGFLTGRLQGDTYFKMHREGQNIDRCRKQFKMVQSMEDQMGCHAADYGCQVLRL